MGQIARQREATPLPNVHDVQVRMYGDRTGYNTMADSLFDAAVQALNWVEIERQSFGAARRFRDDHGSCLYPLEPR
jgi:hypothetical protein